MPVLLFRRRHGVQLIQLGSRARSPITRRAKPSRQTWAVATCGPSPFLSSERSCCACIDRDVPHAGQVCGGDSRLEVERLIVSFNYDDETTTETPQSCWAGLSPALVRFIHAPFAKCSLRYIFKCGVMGHPLRRKDRLRKNHSGRRQCRLV
jgi:hypothetical protein